MKKRYDVVIPPWMVEFGRNLVGLYRMTNTDDENWVKVETGSTVGLIKYGGRLFFGDNMKVRH